VFSAGTHSASKESAAAKELTRFLTSPVAVPVMKQKGLDPA
jgi:hypothetical protein